MFDHKSEVNLIFVVTFDMTKRSDETSLGTSGIYFMVRKNKTARISAQLDDEVGWLKNKNSLVIV